MNDKLEYDHFDNTEELLEHIHFWYIEDDIDYTRWFGLNDLNNLRIYINQLQSNWNSLREWLKNDEQKYFTFQPKQNGKTLQAGIKVGLDMVLDKMNELERGDK